MAGPAQVVVAWATNGELVLRPHIDGLVAGRCAGNIFVPRQFSRNCDFWHKSPLRRVHHFQNGHLALYASGRNGFSTPQRPTQRSALPWLPVAPQQTYRRKKPRRPSRWAHPPTGRSVANGLQGSSIIGIRLCSANSGPVACALPRPTKS